MQLTFGVYVESGILCKFVYAMHTQSHGQVFPHLIKGSFVNEIMEVGIGVL